MKPKNYLSPVVGTVNGAAALTAAAYAAYAGFTWYRYGRVKRQVSAKDADSLVDLYMPNPEIVERHSLRIAAPAATTFSSACKLDISSSAVIRTLFKAREWALACSASGVNSAEQKSAAEESAGRKPLLEQAKEIGWGVLAQVPDHEIVFGAVTQPWIKNPVFRAVPAEEFAKFSEPGYVKIVWTLRADPISATESIARTETRAISTDAGARVKFRRYWSLVSPGVALIRRVLLRALKSDAEREVRCAVQEYETAEFGKYAG